MQNKIFDFANEAAAVNSNLVNSSIELSVKSFQDFVQNSSKQASDWFKVKTLDDYVQTRENWNAITLDQSKKATMSAIELGNEVYGSYLSLWQKYANTEFTNAVNTVDKKKA